MTAPEPMRAGETLTTHANGHEVHLHHTGHAYLLTVTDPDGADVPELYVPFLTERAATHAQRILTCWLTRMSVAQVLNLIDLFNPQTTFAQATPEVPSCP